MGREVWHRVHGLVPGHQRARLSHAASFVGSLATARIHHEFAVCSPRSQPGNRRYCQADKRIHWAGTNGERGVQPIGSSAAIVGRVPGRGRERRNQRIFSLSRKHQPDRLPPGELQQGPGAHPGCHARLCQSQIQGQHQDRLQEADPAGMHDAGIPDRPECQRIDPRWVHPGRSQHLLQPRQERGDGRSRPPGQGDSPRNGRNGRGRPVHGPPDLSAEPRLHRGRCRSGRVRWDRGGAGPGHCCVARVCVLSRGTQGTVSVSGAGENLVAIDVGGEGIGGCH
mmetsp:Transcript_9160/g.27247  ORF Transcript_9160/g.27247 Transcript_9160/m.27247 type:complete len:282 (+) Transcript_9160:955-1800(+)